MDLKVAAYLAYLGIVVPLTIWVGRTLRRHGAVFLVDVFNGDERVAQSVNQLLVIGFYLLNFGFLSNFMASTDDVDTSRALLELLSEKVGGVALMVGGIHLANVWILNTLRHRAIQRAERAGQPIGWWPPQPAPPQPGGWYPPAPAAPGGS